MWTDSLSMSFRRSRSQSLLGGAGVLSICLGCGSQSTQAPKAPEWGDSVVGVETQSAPPATPIIPNSRPNDVSGEQPVGGRVLGYTSPLEDEPTHFATSFDGHRWTNKYRFSNGTTTILYSSRPSVPIRARGSLSEPASSPGNRATPNAAEGFNSTRPEDTILVQALAEGEPAGDAALTVVVPAARCADAPVIATFSLRPKNISGQTDPRYAFAFDARRAYHIDSLLPGEYHVSVSVGYPSSQYVMELQLLHGEVSNVEIGPPVEDGNWTLSGRIIFSEPSLVAIERARLHLSLGLRNRMSLGAVRELSSGLDFTAAESGLLLSISGDCGRPELLELPDLGWVVNVGVQDTVGFWEDELKVAEVIVTLAPSVREAFGIDHSFSVWFESGVVAPWAALDSDATRKQAKGDTPLRLVAPIGSVLRVSAGKGTQRPLSLHIDRPGKVLIGFEGEQSAPSARLLLFFTHGTEAEVPSDPELPHQQDE